MAPITIQCRRLPWRQCHRVVDSNRICINHNKLYRTMMNIRMAAAKMKVIHCSTIADRWFPAIWKHWMVADDITAVPAVIQQIFFAHQMINFSHLIILSWNSADKYKRSVKASNARVENHHALLLRPGSRSLSLIPSVGWTYLKVENLNSRGFAQGFRILKIVKHI